MCGICGIVKRQPLEAADQAAVRRMNAAMAHRGPDGEGAYAGSAAMLAMRRLSIIDVAGSDQPLWNEDRTVALVANGEIYNYKELRAELAGRGHRLATAGDCETIVHLYEESGPDCVLKLRGMFAFALWDAPRGRLLLARDRMGEKPLYLWEADGSLLFASELRALLRSGRVPFELDPAAVDLFFHYQYVPEPRTPVAGVRKLDAGCRLTVDAGAWTLAEHRYWRLEDAPPLDADPVPALRAELETVSKLVVRSDVPVGVALSGGLDSSAVAILAQREYPGNMHAFSVGYTGRPPNDERDEARALADHLEMPFHEVELSTEEMVACFPELVRLRDDPIADLSGYGYYMVAKLAREHGVPVLLQGQGGDELFWGYPSVKEAVRETRLKDRTRRLGWLMLPAYLRLVPPFGYQPWQLRIWLREGCGLVPGWRRFGTHRRTPREQLIFYDKEPDFREARRAAPSLYAPPFRERLGAHSPTELFTFPVPPENLEVCYTALIANTYLRENGIAQGDRLSMASSVEMRLPLVDHRLVETVVGLRKRWPDSHLAPKARLQAALRDVLPDWVRRRPKRGFQPPTWEWYRSLSRRYGGQVRDGYLVGQGVIQPAAAEALAAGNIPRSSVTPLSFKALLLELWCRGMAEATVAERGAADAA